jgi:hypothetical protein
LPAGAGGAEQDLDRLAALVAFDELLDGLGLVAGRLVLAFELELGGHVSTPVAAVRRTL